MIGDRYDSETWNCTHEVSQWYSINKKSEEIKFVDSKNWDMKFVKWMRKNFTPVDKPKHGDLVVMRNKHVGGLHIGVWDNGMIHHCFFPITGGPGQTIRSTSAMIKLTHEIIRYGRYNG